jgi:hypothetical protein
MSPDKLRVSTFHFFSYSNIFGFTSVEQHSWDYLFEKRIQNMFRNIIFVGNIKGDIPIPNETSVSYSNNLEIFCKEAAQSLFMILDILKERSARSLELAEMFVILVIKDMLAEIFPQPLDEIEIGTIWRKKDELHLATLQKFSDNSTAVIPSIINIKVSHQLFQPAVFLLQLFEVFDLVEFHPAILFTPLVIGAVAYAQFFAYLLDGAANCFF